MIEETITCLWIAGVVKRLHRVMASADIPGSEGTGDDLPENSLFYAMKCMASCDKGGTKTCPSLLPPIAERDGDALPLRES